MSHSRRFVFPGSEAVATARKATQDGGFTLVELSRDTWTRGEDGWKLDRTLTAIQRIRGSRLPDPETVRACYRGRQAVRGSTERAGWSRSARRRGAWQSTGRTCRTDRASTCWRRRGSRSGFWICARFPPAARWAAGWLNRICFTDSREHWRRPVMLWSSWSPTARRGATERPPESTALSSSKYGIPGIPW